MAKDSKKDLKDRIKKAVPQNDWLVNVAKSIGFTSLDVVKELIPDNYSTLDWNKDVIDVSSIIKDIRDNNGVRKMFSRQLGNLPHIKLARDGISNIAADLKSGKLYNDDRVLGLDEDGNFTFDDFSFDDSGFEFIDDDSGDEENDNVDENIESRPPIAIINTMPLAKAISSSAEANVDAIGLLADQNSAIESEKILMNKQAYEASLNALNSINDNLALLIQFNSDSTAKYHAAALEYFEQSINLMENSKGDGSNKKKKLFNPFTAEGGLKLDEYIEVIKENLTDIKDSNVALSGVYDFLSSPDLLKGFVDNPLGFLMTEGTKKLLSNKFKNVLGNLDKNVNSMLPALLARINTFEDNDDPLLNTLNKVFGYKYKTSREIDLGDYVKGAISWDGESKKALVEVIPSYLRRIESTLTGGDERIFNYSTGKFDDIEGIRKYYDDKRAEKEVSGFYSVKSDIRDVMSNLDLSSSAKEQVMKDFDEYFRLMTDKGYLIRHKDRKDEYGYTINELYDSGVGDYDDSRVNLMKRILDKLPKRTLTEMGTTAITDSREKLYRFNEEIRENPNLSGYSVLYNDLDKDGRMRYNKDRVVGREKDRYGLTQLDYLRDIRSALINGIRVFPDNNKRYRGNLPNSRLVHKERMEDEEYKRNVAAEEAAKKQQENFYYFESKGRSIEEAANLSKGDWNKIYGKDKVDVDEGKVTESLSNLNDKVEDIIYNTLYGEDNYREIAIDKITKMYKKSKPIMQSMKDFYGDTVKAFKCFFTGQGYVTSDGVKVEGEESLLGSIKTSILGIKEKFKNSTGEGGMFNNFFSDVADGFNTFKTSLFGEKKKSEHKETFQDLMSKVKQRLPKALGIGIAGGMVKTAFASNLGLLGNFLMPGGPLAAVLAGTTFGFLKQSETFQRYVFGEKDKDGNRVGGLISKAWQDKYQEYKGTVFKGAGLGLLGSLFLPGGPIAGALLGIGTSFAAKNEAFQEFLYGKDYKTQDKKSLMNGVFGKVFKNMSGGEAGGDPKLAKFLGTAGLGVGIAQGVGLLPSFLLPGGPIMGAILGLAAGITASSNKFQEFLLGEKDVDGKRYGGLLTKVTNWFNLTFAQPLKIKMTEINDKIYGFMRKKIFDPIARSFEPMVHAVKNVAIDMKNGIVDAFTRVTNPIVEAFKENVINPIKDAVKTAILNPIKRIMKTTFSLLGKGILGILSAPLGIISGVGHLADMYNKNAEIRHEKRRRRKEYDKTHKDDTWDYYERKRAGKMTKEEKEELLNEKLAYRDGKTWRQRKKEQKGELKDEMTRRKERLNEMKKQFEEDKKFAKESGWKYSSKKQQEKREQELKEKERWVQEQQLMKAQDTDEKVGKVSDNVIQLADYHNKTNSKLDDIKDTIKDGFDKLATKFKGTKNNEVDHVNDENPQKIIPDPKEDRTDIKIDTDKVTDPVLKEKFKDVNKRYEQQGTRLIDLNKGTKNNENEYGKYGEVTDDHLNKIYDFLNGKVKPNQDVKPEGGYGNVTDSDLNKIYDYLDNRPIRRDKISHGTYIDPDKVTDPVLKEKVKELNERFKGREELNAKLDKETKGKVIDMNDVRKKLQDDDHSHADGLDKVPNDGYVAELHKGEMVVPEKPAGKLRQMMDKAGKGFSGLNETLNQTSGDNVERKDDDNLQQDTDTGAKGFSSLIGGLASLTGSMTSMFGKILGMSGDEKKDRADNALGLTEEEEDRLKEIEDKARYEHASRKDVDFIQNKIATEKKEKEERKWKDNLLAAVRNVGSFAAAAAGSSLNLFDMIKDLGGNILKGLGSLALPVALQTLMEGANQYQNSEEYIKDHTDVDLDGDGVPDQVTDNYDLVRARTNISARKILWEKPIQTIKKRFVDPAIDSGKKVYKGVTEAGKSIKDDVVKVGNKVYNSKLGKKVLQPVGNKITKGKEFLFGKKTTISAADNVVDFATSKAAKTGTRSADVLKGTGKVINIPESKLMKDTGENAANKTLKKMVSNTAENGGLIKQIIDLGKKALESIGKYAMEKFPKASGLAAKLVKSADNIFGILLKHAGDIMTKFSKKISATLTKIGAGTATGYTIDVVFGVGDLVTGFTAGNAGNLFGVSTENVDARMRTISSIMQTVFNFNFMAIISLINEITNMMFNFNFLRNIAIWLYNLTGGKQNLSSRITAEQIDGCTSIEQALELMGITSEWELDFLRYWEGKNYIWKDFRTVDNKELGGVISSSEQMELARLQYNLENGTSLSSQAFIDKEAKTFGTKAMEWTKKIFTRDTAQQKYNKLTNKAEKKKAKAEEYREKEKNSKTWIGKTWNKGMAWLNEKSAERAEKKAEKTKKKAEKKKAKAETKVNYHQEKAETSKTWLGKKYHEWRANANEKKVERYTFSEDTIQPDGSVSSGGTSTESKKEVPILDSKFITDMYEIPEGEYLEDQYGNKYDHNGKCVYNVNKMSGDAGNGDGEEAVMADEYGNLYGANGNLIKSKTSESKEGSNNTPVVEKHVLNKITDNNKGGKILKKGWDKTKEVINTGKEKITDYYNRQKEISNDVNIALTGSKSADPSLLSDTITTISKLPTAIWNLFAGENNKLEDDDIPRFLGAVIGKAIVQPFQKAKTKAKEKFDEFKEPIVNWVTEKKDAIFGWFNEKIAEPWKKYVDKAKTKIKDAKDKASEWIGDKKDAIFGWFSEHVKEPWKKFIDKRKEKKEQMEENAKSWITDLKDKIVDTFNKYIKDPISKVLSPVTEAVSGAWNNLKKAFEPIATLFNYIKDGKWTEIPKYLKEIGDEAVDDAGESGASIPLNQQIKPKNYVFKETDNQYKEKDAGKTVGGLKDKGNTHNFPFYAQADSRWGKEKLIGGKTIGESGCGPTASAMVLTKITGQHITPDTMAKVGEEHLPGYTSYNYFPQIANKFKLNYSEIEANDTQTLKAKLMEGQPVILSGFSKSNSNMTPYTDKGHIVVATGIEGNNVQINDPRGPEYSGSYSLSTILKGLKRGIVLSPSNNTEQVGLPTSGLYSTNVEMTDKYIQNEDLPVEENTPESLGGDAGQIKLWEKVVGYAKAFKEKLKYVYGSKAIDNNGMSTDCSGFTKHVMDRCGVKISAGSANQKNDGIGVDKSQAQAGDLVVWKGHVGLVVDSNKNMIDAGSGSVPKIRSYETDYWRSRGDYVIRRVLPNPNEMVSAKVDNPHTGIGFNGIVSSQGGADLAPGSGGSISSTTTGTTATATTTETVDELGLFGKMKNIGVNLMASIFNGKDVDVFAAQNTSDNVSTTTTGGTVDISGINDNAKAVYTFLTGKGYTPEAAAGILGNMEQESGVNPKAIQGGGKGPAAGIVQWENYNRKSARWKSMSDYAASKGKDWTDLQSQLEWLDLELQGKDPTTASLLKKKVGGYEQFKAIKDVNQAVKVFEESFERAGKPNMTRRYNAAQNYYNQFKNGASVANEDAGRGFNMATSAETASGDSIPTSMNGWAYYKQTDPQWQEDISGKKIGPSGCGMASHAMMLTTMFGKQVTPVTVGKWARANGQWNSGMSWSMPPAIASKLGLQIVDQQTNDGGLGTSALSNLKQTIKSGYPAILSGKGQTSNLNTPFTSGGHIVLAVGVDGNDNLIINDPRGPQYTKAYTDEGVMNIGTGLRGYWAFDSTNNAKLPEDWGSGDYVASSTGVTGTDTTTGGTTEAVDELGIFGKLKTIGSTLLSDIYSGKTSTGTTIDETDASNETTTADTTAGNGDGKTYLVSPPKGDAGKGEKITYNKPVVNNTGKNTTDINAQRNLDDINRKMNIAMNNINPSNPNAYAEVLKLIVQELQAINSNTAATVNGIKNIEIIPANSPVGENIPNEGESNVERYKNGKKPKQVSKLQTINQSTGYSLARQIAGYKKNN